MIPPIVEPITFKRGIKRVSQDTRVEFRISQADADKMSGAAIHKFDHIEQNIQIAPNINQLRLNNHIFKRSVLNKSSAQNLKIL